MTDNHGNQPANTTPEPRHAIPADQKWNGFAIAGFIFGILGGWLGLIFGGVALRQIKEHGGKGKGLAIAGIILCVIWILISILLVVSGQANL